MCRGRRGRGTGGRAVRALRPSLLQRVQPPTTRAPHPRVAAGCVHHLRALLQDAALPPETRAGAARAAPTRARTRTQPRTWPRPCRQVATMSFCFVHFLSCTWTPKICIVGDRSGKMRR